MELKKTESTTKQKLSALNTKFANFINKNNEGEQVTQALIKCIKIKPDKTFQSAHD